jgi:hypothetical protein
MIRRILALGAVLALLPALLAASARSPAQSTVLSVRLMNAAGNSPMAGAHVVVFFMPPGDGSPALRRLPQLGTGTADSVGSLQLTLDTSEVPPGDLGDVGTGNDAFNATILAWDAEGQYNITQAIIQEGRTFSYQATAGTNPTTGRAALLTSASVSGLDSDFADGVVPLAERPLYSRYRYSLITPLNVGPGLHGSLAYTYDKSTAKQSEFELPTTEYGGVTLTQNQLEEKDRTVHTGIKANGSYHRWVWAEYYFVYYIVCICGDRATLTYHQWQPDHFQGTVADNNPNVPKGRTKPVGHLAFKQPRYNKGPGGAWAVEILPDSLPWERDNGTRQENDVDLGFSLGSLPHGISGGSISLEDITTYGSITSVTWTYRSGCKRGDVRVVWGARDDPVDATRVMSSCVPRSQG